MTTQSYWLAVDKEVIMTRWDLIQELRSASQDPDRFGDVPVLKSELTGSRGNAQTEARLDPVRGYHPHIDIDAIASLPDGTFGREYARFMAANNIQPIVLTGNLPRDMVARNAMNVRYGIIHDMVHVLLGFDTSWVGEVGVWAFVGAQNYGGSLNFASWMSLVVAPFRAPLRLGECWRAFWRGRQMGKTADFLIAVKLEEMLELPLEAVRKKLNIVGGTAGYLPPLRVVTA